VEEVKMIKIKNFKINIGLENNLIFKNLKRDIKKKKLFKSKNFNFKRIS
jgi:hypothetical protein